MDTAAFAQPPGRLVQTPQDYVAFLPAPLPREFVLDATLVFKLSQADRVVGELAGMARMLPNPGLLIAPLSQREAVLSSRIEGTRASISDLAIMEASGTAHGDTQEVFNYRRALEYGLQRLETLPLSLRLVREVHAELMTGVRGQEKTPGEFRTEQNWIGPYESTRESATYIPPPPSELTACLGDWERFLHEETLLPPIVRCALMHYQFEAIYPFLDGNGRVGRLLNVLFLVSLGHLSAPVLYLSPYFERHRERYYALLRGVTERSAWGDWLAFFVESVLAQAGDALVRLERTTRLHEKLRQQLIRARAAPSAQQLLEQLFVNPATTVSTAAQDLGMTVVSATRAIQALVEQGILREATGRRRDRIFVAQGLIDAIEDDTSEDVSN